ncbi:MAG: 1,6-anhydro-N-acetylmuramyl-L-alanine amidase AmpD [Gammaproteobacteria bacterium]|nr:1,6-anhydro-N-acetylmuramyl-L-alanine amidase AmpD [Gammaproteobacteria bacterium]
MVAHVVALAAPCQHAGVNIDSTHWLDGARRVPSPNFDERPLGCDIELLVVHAISLPPGEFGGPQVEQLFANCLDCTADSRLADLADVRVSSHLFVDRTGAITQFVPFDRRAWHAGLSSHRGRQGCNDFAIGIELEGADAVAFEDRQYRVLADVVATLMRRYPRLTLANIVGHSDVAPLRKSDPGHVFDWATLVRLVLERL